MFLKTITFAQENHNIHTLNQRNHSFKPLDSYFRSIAFDSDGADDEGDFDDDYVVVEMSGIMMMMMMIMLMISFRCSFGILIIIVWLIGSTPDAFNSIVMVILTVL